MQRNLVNKPHNFIIVDKAQLFNRKATVISIKILLIMHNLNMVEVSKIRLKLEKQQQF